MWIPMREICAGYDLLDLALTVGILAGMGALCILLRRLGREDSPDAAESGRR